MAGSPVTEVLYFYYGKDWLDHLSSSVLIAWPMGATRLHGLAARSLRALRVEGPPRAAVGGGVGSLPCGAREPPASP